MLNRKADFFIIDILVSYDAISRHMINVISPIEFVAKDDLPLFVQEILHSDLKKIGRKQSVQYLEKLQEYLYKK